MEDLMTLVGGFVVGLTCIGTVWVVVALTRGLLTGPSIEDILEQDHAARTGGTAAPLAPPPTATLPYDPLPVPPSPSKVLLITGGDGLMWYSEMIGQEVPYCGVWRHEGYWSREPAGYSNIVLFKDAKVIDKGAQA